METKPTVVNPQIESFNLGVEVGKMMMRYERQIEQLTAQNKELEAKLRGE